jgi:peptidyl-tRNA hydrolase, PTH1 family
VVIKVICGLGNPGPRYRHTRHNLGFDVVDGLAARLALETEIDATRFSYRVVATDRGAVYMIKPRTYVNASGVAVAEAVGIFNADPSELFVISDDFHLPLGTLRIRKAGSSGGHNGLESILEHLGRDDFVRMRCGIGPLPEWAVTDREKTPDFVLSPFRSEEQKIVNGMISRAVEALMSVLDDSLDLAISRYNSVNPTPEN